jgi:hypothetical protein
MVCLPHTLSAVNRTSCKPLKSNNNECNSLVQEKHGEKTIPLRTADLNKKNWRKLHRHLLQATWMGTINITMKTVEHSVDSTTFKYCDTVPDKLHVSALVKRTCVHGRCANKMCSRTKLRAILFMCNLNMLK